MQIGRFDNRLDRCYTGWTMGAVLGVTYNNLKYIV